MNFTNHRSATTIDRNPELSSSTVYEEYQELILDENIGEQISRIVDEKTHADDYQLFCESQLYISENQSTIPNPGQMSKTIDAIDNIVLLPIDEITNDPINFEFLMFKAIMYFDSLTIMILDNLIENGKIDHLLAIKILSYLGRINHPNTFHHRTLLLAKSLKHKSRYIREGARLGLLYLKNPSVIPSIKQAIEREYSELLKEKLIYTLEKLEN